MMRTTLCSIIGLILLLNPMKVFALEGEGNLQIGFLPAIDQLEEILSEEMSIHPYKKSMHTLTVNTVSFGTAMAGLLFLSNALVDHAIEQIREAYGVDMINEQSKRRIQKWLANPNG